MSQSEGGSDYLWDKTGEPDPDVQFLENALAPLAHDSRPMPESLQGRPRRNIYRYLVGLAAAAAFLLAGALVYQEVFGGPSAADRAAQLQLVRASDRSMLYEGDRLVTDRTETLTLGDDISTITVEPGSVLWVDRLQKELTHLRLERGSLSAFVSGEAKERFFQVATPATNCVDLGCEYTLTVDENETATVEVTMGRVAFADVGREVLVPANATCTATKQDGAGTPRHVDTPEPIVALVDAFDASRGVAGAGRRLALAVPILNGLAALVRADEPKYSLIAWHFLRDPSGAVRGKAQAWLLRYFADRRPEGFVLVSGRGLTEGEIMGWRENLEPDWGW